MGNGKVYWTWGSSGTGSVNCEFDIGDLISFGRRNRGWRKIGKVWGLV